MNLSEEDKEIQKHFVEKTWDETVTKDSWMIFKVMEIAEKLDGYVQEIEDYPELELGENYVVGITLQFQKNLKMLEFVKSLKENLK